MSNICQDGELEFLYIVDGYLKRIHIITEEELFVCYGVKDLQKLNLKILW